MKLASLKPCKHCQQGGTCAHNIQQDGRTASATVVKPEAGRSMTTINTSRSRHRCLHDCVRTTAAQQHPQHRRTSQ